MADESKLDVIPYQALPHALPHVPPHVSIEKPETIRTPLGTTRVVISCNGEPLILAVGKPDIAPLTRAVVFSVIAPETRDVTPVAMYCRFQCRPRQ